MRESFILSSRSRSSLCLMLGAAALITACEGRDDESAASPRLGNQTTQAGAPITLVSFNLSAGGGGTQFMASGWSVPEDAFTWTEGKTSEIVVPAEALPATFAADDTGRGWQLDLTAWAFLPNIRSGLRVDVSVNGVPVDTLEFSLADGGDQPRLYSIDLGDTWSIGDSLMVRLEIDDPRSPAEMGVSPDERQLGIAVSSVSIVASPS